MKRLSTFFATFSISRKLPLQITLITSLLIGSITTPDIFAQRNDDAQPVEKVLRESDSRDKNKPGNKKSANERNQKNYRSTSLQPTFGKSLEGDDIKPIEKVLRAGTERNTTPTSTSDGKIDPNVQEIVRNVPGDHPTIQAAINAASNGDIISVAPGIYRENITLNKFLSIRGANYGINPNTGVRGSESIIQPGTSDPDPNSPTAVTFFYIEPGGSGSTIDGFTFDGDNNLLISSVNINGANIDAAEAIGAYDGLSNTTIRNNIVKNLNYAGIDFYNFTNGGASTYDNVVTGNLFDNIIPNLYGIAVLIYNNCYTSITSNVMTRVRIGIQTGNFYNSDLGTNHSITNNEVESYRVGIFHNLAYTNATAYTISDNVFTTLAGAPNNNGMVIASIQSAVGATITDNDVSDARVGCNLWNCPTTNTITITGGNLTDCNIGVFPNNYDGYSSDAATSSYIISGVNITNCDTSIWIRDNNLNTNSSTVTLNINNTTNAVSGSGIGLLIEGGDAFVNFNGSVPVDFSTSHSKYIRLISNGSSYPVTDISALNVQFGGTNGAGLSNSQLFAVEDKIDHKMDFDTLGFVRVKADNSYITVNSFYLPETFSASIQNAIDITPAGDTISAAQGVYREDITLDKQLILRGTNFGINPNTGVRVPETIIQPGSSDPDPNSPTALTYFYISPSGSGSHIDGFTFDGDNTTITSAVNINGANIDAAEAIGAYEGLSDFKLQNNIVKNLNYAAIDLYNYYNSGAATTGNDVSENLFDNIIPNAFGIAVLIYNNCYTDITDNVMTRVRVGIQTGNFYNSDPGTSHDISNNDIESYRLGIFHNLAYTNATAFNVTTNSFTTVAGAPNNNGMLFSSIGSAVGANITDNDVTDARIGCNLWNCTTTSTITVTGGNITDCNIGVFPNNYDGYTSNANTSTYAITGVTITNCDTSIWIRDNNLNTNSSTVTLNINNTTNVVNGTGIGLLIEGGDAFVNFNGAIPVDFSSTHSKYIRLTTNGSSYPTANINAQSVRFGGLNGAGMSNTQLFDVEDKTDHKIDFNSLGFVSVKPNNSYVTVSSFYLPNTSVPSIQNAVNIAAPGDIVNLDSGTFNENVIVSNSISLIGSGTGATILTPTVACTGDGLNITASNVNVSNLRLTNFNYGIRTSSSNTDLYNVESVLNCQYGINVGNGTSNLSMIKCKFNNNTVGGWRSGTAEMATNIYMDSCEVKRNGVGASNGFGIFIAATTPAANIYDSVTIKNSDFRGNLKKGMYFEKLRNALIENVNLDSNGTDATYGFNNGIDVNLKYDAYSNISIINCTITNSGFNGTAVDPNNPAAVTIKARDDAPSYSADPASLTGVTFNNNFVSGPVNGLRFGEFNKTNNSPTGVIAIENSFGNGYSNKAIVNKTANTITVSCNWYGTTIPTAVVALHSSGLNFLPYLVNGTDNDLGAAGFQIVPGSCTGAGPVTNLTQNTNYIAIQPAIDAANPGDVIEASAGTYNEKVTVTKSLTLQGVDRTTVVVDGTGFVAPAKGITINNAITNVTIQNLTVQNFAGSGGNSDGGIYAIGGNNNLIVNNVTIQNNSNGSGFYANGPVNNVLLDSVTASGHTVGARGIVIWNGLKENITITNCEVFGNNCCGIELQDGTASGVTVSNNYIHDNGDNGIGIVGLQGPGENLISGNTLVNNGRFGIEIKNPNGSGLTTGPGRVVVENNNVSRNVPIADARDIAGIAAFRRGVLAGNVDIPNGTVIQNNTVSGYVQSSTSDGFGIVVEGTNHTVSGNTVTGCDVGIQRQAGHLPYPGDGDQNDLADAYFGRGNSPSTCGVTIGINTLTNTVNTRDVGAVAGGIVTNINTSEIFCSIQSAVNDAQTLNGHTITVDPGTYNEQVLVTKEVTITGIGAVKPVVNFTGTVSGKPTLFDVSVKNVTIRNLRMKVDQTKLSSAIIASGTDIDNIAVKSDSIEAYASSAAGAFGGYGNWNAISINYSGATNYRIAAGGVDNINVDSNTVSGVVNDGFGNPRFFRAAVAVDEGGGSFTNNTMQSINHDVLVRFGSNGNINITNNNLIGGGVELSDMNAGAGTLTVANNIFDGTFANSSAPGAAVLRLKNNYNSKTTLVNSNTFSNHQWATSIENYNSLTLDGNTFTPLANSTTFHHVAVNTKSISTNSNAILQVPVGLILTNNTFNYSGTIGGTALSFHNHDNDAASFGTFTLGTLGNENNFNSGIANFIYLDAQTGVSSGSTFPAYTALIGAGAGALTTMACWALDMNIESNKFDVGTGLKLPTAMNFSERSSLEAGLFHKPDNACLGSLIFFQPVHNLTQNTYYQTIQSAINAANANDVIECSEFTYNEKVTIDKSLTVQGVDRANCVVTGTGFAAPAKGITINNAITNVTIQNLTVQNFAGSGGNSDGGIYAIGGNNNLIVNNVTIQNNSNGSGFYANGPVNNILIDSVTASGHTVGARGIVIWNGLKENITITNCEVFGNNCCGIELQDGTASGVTISNNYIHDNGDNGIGLVGLQGPGQNLISNNTLVNNGRFGIEIKNPNGSGLTTGPGRVVVENNNVSRNVPIVDARDIAGIAAFRRSVLAGNVDVPNGAVIQNNTVSGYTQPSTSDGFGIVVEGTNHTVSGNTVTGCDVGIQRQAGHLPYPGDGNQNDIADTYFGRGNSPITCAITISGNILTNTLNTRDVGASTGSGIVMNINTNEMFCSIQAAIDDAQTLNGHVIDIDSATYTESVVVNKQVTLKGNGGSPNGRPTIVGVAGQAVSVTAPNVTIDNIIVNFDQVAVNTGIRAATSGTFNNLTVKNSCIFGTGNTGLPIFASFGLQLGSTGGVQYDQVNLDSNEIKHIGTSWIGRGIRTLNCFGDWKNSTVDGYYAFQSGDNQGGLLNITGNNTKGTNELNYFGAGAHSFVNNICKPASAFGGGTDFAMLELKNISLPASSLNITGNSFEEYVNFGIFSGRSNNITIDNNTFIPEPSAVNFRSIRIDTKQRTLPAQPAFVSGAVITNNTFFGSVAAGENGISVELANSDNVSSIGTVVIGTPGNGNIFNTNTKKFISLNNETLSTAGDPVWTGTYVSTKAKVNVNVSAVDNQFDAGAGVQLPTAMNLNTLFALENLIQHTIDDGGLGLVTVKANNTYVTINSFVAPATTTASVQRGINAASSGFNVNVNSGTYTGAINVNKGVKLLGLNSAISPNTGIRNPEAKLATTSGIMMNVTTTEPVDIRGFEVANSGGAFDYSITGVVDANVRLEKNFFNNSIGLYFPNSDTINVIDNRCTFSSGADEGMALFGDYNGSTGTYSDIHDNVFLNGQMTGFNLSNINGKVYHNNFTNIAYYALLVANLCNLDIYENNFTNIANPDTTVTTWGAGIRFYDDANGAIVSVHNNFFSGNYNGITARSAYDFTGTTVNVTDNSITGSTRWNIRNEGIGSLPATCNWFGSASNDTISTKLSGTIGYTPWLTVGVDNDLGTVGFQPVPGSCTGQPIIAGTLNLKIKLEASTCADTVIVHMRSGTTPFALVSADTAVMDTAGNVVLNFPSVVNGTNYYIAVFHRNSMETWSATTQVFTLGTMTYDFTTGVNKAYGNNMKLVSGTARIYTGDVNQDDIIDGSDVLLIDNDAFNFVFGYTDTDLNCDGTVDGTDLVFADNNAFSVVTVSKP